jgi:hypothetical protein
MRLKEMKIKTRLAKVRYLIAEELRFMFDVRDFINTVDPVKLKRMYKAETSGNKKEYNRIRIELLNEYRRLKDN